MVIIAADIAADSVGQVLDVYKQYERFSTKVKAVFEAMCRDHKEMCDLDYIGWGIRGETDPTLVIYYIDRECNPGDMEISLAAFLQQKED